jgi:hypothetical protein
MRNQFQDETFDKYVTELKILALTCNYGALHDSLIRDRMICGINDSNLRERLLRVADLDLQKCLEICRADFVLLYSCFLPQYLHVDVDCELA